VKSLQLPRTPARRGIPWRGVAAVAIPILVGLWLVKGDEWSGRVAPSASVPGKSTDNAVANQPSSSTSSASANRDPSTATPPVAASGDVVLESKGYVIPAHQILVSPKVTGMVKELKLVEGMTVKEGDILAILESDEFQADYDRTQANLELARQRLRELENGTRPDEIKQAEAELAEARAQLVDLEPNYRRAQELRQKNIVTEREVQTAESQYTATMRRVDRLQLGLALLREGPRIERIDAARAEVKQAEADLTKTAWRLGNCTIRAPVSGTILKKNAERGNIVNPMAFNGSFSLCELADLSDLEIDLSIQERDVSRVFTGQKCRIRAEAWPERSYEGFVSRLMPIADRAKGAIPVRVKVTVPAGEQGQFLKPEMSAVVSFFAK